MWYKKEQIDLVLKTIFKDELELLINVHGPNLDGLQTTTSAKELDEKSRKDLTSLYKRITSKLKLLLENKLNLSTTVNFYQVF